MLLIKNFTKHRIDQKYLNEIVDETLKIAKFKNLAEISLVITGEKRIRNLNKKYGRIDKVTDVLSFGNEGKHNTVKFIDPMDGVAYLGEIFICYPRAEKQARERGHSTKKELAILLIHGILHLLGYDHKRKNEYVKMRRKEEKVLANLR